MKLYRRRPWWRDPGWYLYAGLPLLALGVLIGFVVWLAVTTEDEGSTTRHCGCIYIPQRIGNITMMQCIPRHCPVEEQQ